MGSSKKVTLGYRYYMTLFLGLCRGPINRLLMICAGGKTVWSGAVSTTHGWPINQPNLFGGEKKEGGIDGNIMIQMGDRQTPHPVIVSHIKAPAFKLSSWFLFDELWQRFQNLLTVALGFWYPPSMYIQPIESDFPDPAANNVPAFKDIVVILYDGLISCMNPYIKPWQFQLDRTTAGWDRPVWYPDKATITLTDENGYSFHAANPAHIIYESLTNRSWGAGVDPSLIDDAAFRAFADTCYAEGFGLCLRWNRSANVGEFISTIIDHAGAVYFRSPRTGLHAVKALRGDYDAAALPLFDENSGLLGIDEDENTSLAGSTNEIIIKWTNPKDGEPSEWRERNLGMISASGQIVTDILELPAIPTADLAGRVAVRELLQRGGGVKKVTVRMDRRAYLIQPGDVFRVASTRRGIDNMILRCIKIDDGTLTEATITLTCIIDIFGLPQTAHSDIPESDWIPPQFDVQPVILRKVLELSWRDLALATDAANLSLVDPGAAHLGVFSSPPNSSVINYVPATHIGSGDWIVSDVNGDFCDSYVLFSEAIPVAAAPILLTLHAVYGGIEPFVAGAGFMIDDEIFRIVAVDMENFQITAARGCVDTVPAAHLSQTIAWFIDDVQMLAEEWTSGVTIDVRLLSQTSSDLLDLVDAPVDTLTLVGRQGRPYPPGQFKINGVAYPDTTPGSIKIDPATTSASSSDPDMPPTPDYVATDAGGEQWIWWAFNGQKIVGGITLTGGETDNGKSIAAMLNGAQLQYTTGNPSGSATWMTTDITVAGLDDTGALLDIHFPGIACRAIRLYKEDGQIGVIGATLDAGGIAFRTPPDEITITWAHRDRILQADQLVDTSMGNIGPEPGTTYRVRIYNGDTLIRIYEGITGTTCTYTVADEIADGGPFASLRVVLDAQRDGLYSTQAHNWTIERG